jgi:ribose transport system substrate-binding protein
MKKFSIMVLALILSLVPVLCYAAEMPKGTLQSMINPDDEYVVVCVLDNIEYWNAHRYGWKKAGELWGVKTSWTGMPGFDVAEMSNMFDNVAAKNPAGIVVLGWDPGLAPSIDRAEEAGIPVVTFSGDVENSKRETWVGSNQHDLGFVGGTKYAELIGGKGKVAILTIPGNEMFDGRQAGFEDAFKNYPEIDVVAIGDTKADQAIAVQAAADIITAHPDLTGFVCTDSTGANGAATAIAEAGMTGKIDLLGLDRDTDLLRRIKEGTITGSIVQDDVTMLYWALSVLVTSNYYAPYAMLTSDNAAAGAKLTPNKINCAINFIDKSNVDYYIAANEEFLK